jgi:hypothetical protein
MARQRIWCCCQEFKVNNAPEAYAAIAEVARRRKTWLKRCGLSPADAMAWSKT